MSTNFVAMDGGCTCRQVRYRISCAPLFVHCCHCRWCQRETGTAFALNAMIEAEHVELLEGEVEMIDTPSNSGKGQRIARCPQCRVALWSHYATAGDQLNFVRAGTLDEPEHLPPDIHIFTESKQPWVQLTGDKPVMAQFYRPAEQWSANSLERWARLMAKKPAT